MVYPPRKIRSLLALFLVLTLEWFAQGALAQALDDGFTDGGRSNGADPTDTGWYTLNVSGSALSVVDDSSGIGAGNALRFAPTSTFQAFVAGFPSVTLADGDSVALFFDWRFTGTTNLNQPSRLRFGVHNSNGSAVTSDNGSATANDVGYFCYTNPGLDSSSGTGIARESSGDAILMGTNFTSLDSSGASVNAGTSVSTVALLITRVGSTLQISASIDGAAPSTAVDASPITYTFNQIGICTGATSVPSPLLVDNVHVASYPALVNEGFTDGGRTNGTDTQDINWYYLGAPFSLNVVDDDAGIGSGNAVQLHPSGTFQGIVGNTPWVHLGDGDTLTMSFDWRFLGTSGLNESNKLRFGLHYAHGTVTNADNDSPDTYENDNGYFVATNPGLASSTGTTLFRETPVDGILSGSGFTSVGTSGSSINAGTTKHSAVMTITRSGTSLILSSSIDGQPAAIGTDTSPTTYMFDEISMRLCGSATAPKFLVDNVKMSYTSASPIHEEGPPDGIWNLVLDEQFNGTSLNTSIWSKGYRYKEPNKDDISAMRPENVTIANGVCTILAEKRTAQNKDMWGNSGVTQNYCGGVIQGYTKWTQTYGYFEARLKLPTAAGTWPAFWLMPDRGSNYDEKYRTQVGNTVKYPNGTTVSCIMGNEIDIFEHMGSWIKTTDYTKLKSGYFWNYGGGSSGEYVHTTGFLGNFFLQNPDTQFHTYGLYWGPGQLVYYVDGKVSMRRQSSTNVSVAPEFLILNCGVSTNDWTGTPVPLAEIDAALPSNMVIDYVRVYSGTPSPAL